MKKNHLGISMIEVLISMGIISLILLSLLSYQISAIKNINQTRYQTIATIQLMNLSEMLRVNTADCARNSALKTWNNDNKNLLPRGGGTLHQIDDHQCEITVNWFLRKREVETRIVYC